jgi:alanine dehydrogenase
MRVGIPREIKIKENRVSCTPGGVRMLVGQGHEVLVEQARAWVLAFPTRSIAWPGL